MVDSANINPKNGVKNGVNPMAVIENANIAVSRLRNVRNLFCRFLLSLIIASLLMLLRFIIYHAGGFFLGNHDISGFELKNK